MMMNTVPHLWRSVFARLIVSTMIATAFVASGLQLTENPDGGHVATAQAAGWSDGGGSAPGGCDGGCALSSPFYWVNITSDNGNRQPGAHLDSDGMSLAWRRFSGENALGNGKDWKYGLSGWRSSTTVRYVQEVARRTNNKTLLANCRKSELIWILAANARSSNNSLNGPTVWAHNYKGGSTNPTRSSRYKRWYQSRHWSTPNPNDWAMPSYKNPALVAQMMDWFTDNYRNDYVILCSGVNGIALPRTKIKSELICTTTSDSAKVRRPYAYYATVNLRRITDTTGKNTKDDPIGQDNLHDQAPSVVITNFGKLVNDINKNPTKYAKSTPAQIRALVSAALAKDATLAKPKVNLDAANKAGMAEGGILDVTEMVSWANTPQFEVTTQKCKRDYYEGTETSAGSNIFTWEFTDSVALPPVQTFGTIKPEQPETPQVNRFWQMLSVHCNKADYDRLRAEVPSASSFTAGGVDANQNTSIAAAARTTNYAFVPNVAAFGAGNAATSTARYKSSTLAFYDKECPYECTPSKTSTSATTGNGASSNVGSTANNAKTAKAKYGATYKNVNNNKFEFFRDNKTSRVDVDVWYPKSSDVVKYTGTAPLTTTISRWVGGTPKLNNSGAGGSAKIATSVAGKPGTTLFTENGEVGTQRNWDRKTGSESTVTILSGLHRSFLVSATWPSEKNMPHVLNVKWEYNPIVTTKVPVSGIGFDSKSAAVVGTIGNVTSTIEGKCYASYGTKTSLNTTKTFYDNTGTGTINEVDKTLVQGVATPPADVQTNLFFKFVRATTE